ncbi:MAG: sensor histidine kinase [Dyadobacter fermentans]
MKVTRLSFAMHALVWVLLLVVPYVPTDQVFSALDPSLDLKYLQLCLILSSLLLVVFYINYFFLIPRYLLSKWYWTYFSSLLLLILIAGLVFWGLLYFNPIRALNANPVVEKILPIIIVNALLLWSLSIVSSILWTIYNRLRETESERLSAQIASLKSQINPHFLFNTLNNIYAIAIDSSPVAADMVDKLSEMMRYTMKDTQQDFVLLEDEINYISNYIELQKLRLDRSVRLEYDCPENVPPLRIAPMLLIPFVENAFKHGVNSEQKSRIRIAMELDNSQFQLSVRIIKLTCKERSLSEAAWGSRIQGTG